MSQITVIVPVYNVEPYLRRCVDSILSQTFTDIDLLLIDDGSPDRCGEICEEYAQEDIRVHVIHHNENLGLSAARNTGIEWALQESDSEWISFVDSDDWVHPLYLKALYEAVQGYNLSICAHSNTHGEELPQVTTYSIQKWDPVELCLNKWFNVVAAWGKIYRKDVFLSYHFPIGKIYEDAFVVYKIVLNSTTIPFISQSLYAYYHNENGITKSTWSPAKLDLLEAIEEQIDYLSNRNLLSLARERFLCFADINRYMQSEVLKCDSLSYKEKKNKLSDLRSLQKILLRKYKRYHWCSIWNKGNELWAYSNAYISFHTIHYIWRKLKQLLRIQKV